MDVALAATVADCNFTSLSYTVLRFVVGVADFMTPWPGFHTVFGSELWLCINASS